MYLYTLQNESFVVAIANTRKRADGCAVGDEAVPAWEITRAQKCEWVHLALEKEMANAENLL